MRDKRIEIKGEFVAWLDPQIGTDAAGTVRNWLSRLFGGEKEALDKLGIDPDKVWVKLGKED